MTTPSFFWHDYETWGADARRDRPSQFAGIRTDMDLNIIDEPVVLHCALADDYLPSPMACLVTGLVPQDVADALPESEFFARIQAELGRPGTCGIGYNSLQFDDEITRFGLYRNFRDPYAREWQNGNSRWDLINVVRLARALRPKGIVWPRNAENNPSFRLEDLTRANGIEHANAHDALADVYATIAIAKLIKDKHPKLWQYAFENRDKRKLEAQFTRAERPILLHVSQITPASLGHISPIVVLAQDPTVKTSYIAFDLRQDPEPVLSLDVETLRGKIFQSKAERGEAAPIGLRQIATNKFPVVVSDRYLDEELAATHSLNIAEIRERHQRLLADPQLAVKLRAVYDTPAPKAPDADYALYDGFIGNEDRATCNKVLASTPRALNEDPPKFADARLNTLLLRYRARNWPASLTEAEQQQWRAERRARLVDGAGEYRTFAQVRADLETLKVERTSERDQQLLAKVGDYIDQVERSLASA